MSQLSHDSAIVNSTRSISELLRQQKEQLNEFFFAKESPIGVALARIVICATVFIVMLDRWKYVREIYSTDGAPAQISVNFGFGELFPVFRECSRSAVCHHALCPADGHGGMEDPLVTDCRQSAFHLFLQYRLRHHHDQVLGHCDTYPAATHAFPLW